ncbi:Gp138 family membrane-puncturing spike protein [Paenibacillus caui]|uniref:Gp138 family membrane-puncturing spike protein n=1 Tax=Paenibacillus caui TaxID=2873927 RepID=UPI001CA7EAF5|nr:Gp138 family membrane-puncturing spike protein [Paenibacillus caui]
MKSDPSGVLYQVLTAMIHHSLSQARVGIPCRVIRFDSAGCSADVQPLIRTTKHDPAIIHSVPVLGHRLLQDGSSIEAVYRPVLKNGDIVFVVCADRELKNARTGKVATADTDRQHSVNDAVIVGVFPWSL